MSYRPVTDIVNTGDSCAVWHDCLGLNNTDAVSSSDFGGFDNSVLYRSMCSLSLV